MGNQGFIRATKFTGQPGFFFNFEHCNSNSNNNNNNKLSFYLLYRYGFPWGIGRPWIFKHCHFVSKYWQIQLDM